MTIIVKQFTGTTAGWEPRFTSETNYRHLCKLKCCTSCSYCTQAFAKERSKSRVRLFSHQKSYKLKYVKGASCVPQLSCVKPGTNVKNAASNPPVGARLQNFWQTWLNLGADPKIVQILKEGYTLPFRTWPNFTRSPTVISHYVNPHRNSYLLEALHQLMSKNAVELVQNKKSRGFFNRLFLVPKPNNK